MIKVLIISHAYVTGFNQRKICALSKFGNLKIILIAPDFWKDQLRSIRLERTCADRFNVLPAKICFNGKISGYFLLNRLFKILKNEKPDIIHIEEEPWSFVACQIILYKKLLRLKSKIIVFTWENILRKYRQISNIIESFVLKNTDFFIAGSKEAKSVLIAKGVLSNKIAVIPQIGVDITDTSKEKNISALNTCLADCFTVGFIGRLVEEKGIMILLKALLKLKNKWKLLIIGDGPVKQEISIFANKNLIEDKVIFTGTVPHEKINEYFPYIDILVIPSITTETWKEQFGHVIIEAFSNSVPVIGSSSGSIPEVIGDAGLIFNEGDEKELSDKIKFLIDNTELRKKFTELGKKRVLGNFTNEIIAEKTYKLYKTYENSNTNF